MEKAFAYICAASDAAPRLLKRYCRKVYELGYVPICPKLSEAQYLQPDNADEKRDFHSIARQKLGRCRMLVMCGNEISHSMSAEIGAAEKRNLICTTLDGLAKIKETRFQVEQVVVLCDEQFRQFQETGLKEDQIFLFDYSDKMWFDPGSFCWHCVLVKGENSRDGILVDAEGYSYARYAAFAPDCGKLRLRDIPVHYEYPARAPEQKKSRHRGNAR